MKKKIVTFAVCSLLLAASVCTSAAAKVDAPFISSCFIFGDVAEGY